MTLQMGPIKSNTGRVICVYSILTFAQRKLLKFNIVISDYPEKPETFLKELEYHKCP